MSIAWEETFKRRIEELDEIAISPSGEVVPRLRILPAEEPKKEASTFGVVLGLLALGGTVLTLAGMKLFDLFWRLTR